MKILKKAIVLLGFAIFLAAPVLTIAAPVNTYATKSPQECEKPLLGIIRPWFRGLATVDKNDNCGIVSPGQTLPGESAPLEISGFIWRIALNVIDIVLTLVGFIAFFFIMYGGFQYLTGGDKPAQVESAKKTILNAVIGLVISIVSTAIVNLIFGILG